MSETLNFGPQWLRALSTGTSVTSPPPSPGIGIPAGLPPSTVPTQFKLAEHRYGREEMLALYRKSEKMPCSLEDVTSIAKREALTPMALLPLNDEEQVSRHLLGSFLLRLFQNWGGGEFQT